MVYDGVLAVLCKGLTACQCTVLLVTQCDRQQTLSHPQLRPQATRLFGWGIHRPSFAKKNGVGNQVLLPLRTSTLVNTCHQTDVSTTPTQQLSPTHALLQSCSDSHRSSCRSHHMLHPVSYSHIQVPTTPSQDSRAFISTQANAFGMTSTSCPTDQSPLRHQGCIIRADSDVVSPQAMDHTITQPIHPPPPTPQATWSITPSLARAAVPRRAHCCRALLCCLAPGNAQQKPGHQAMRSRNQGTRQCAAKTTAQLLYIRGPHCSALLF
jgi:hypothetical protein